MGPSRLGKPKTFCITVRQAVTADADPLGLMGLGQPHLKRLLWQKAINFISSCHTCMAMVITKDSDAVFIPKQIQKIKCLGLANNFLQPILQKEMIISGTDGN